jgi:acetyl esterase/lipase
MANGRRQPAVRPEVMRFSMPKTLLPALTAGLVLVCPLWVRADDARALIEKAIQAHGGPEKLARLHTVHLTARGAFKVGADVPFTLETYWRAPDRLKNVVTTGPAEKTTTLIETIAGGESWSSRDGKVGSLSAAKLDELHSQAHVRRLLVLTPLLSDKSYELSALDDIRVEDRPAAGMRVRCPGERDVKLYFDKDTSRLVKLERRIYDEVKKKERRQEEFFSDYKDTSGVPAAMKQVWLQDGEKVLEKTLTEINYPQRLDPATFADPRPYTRRRDVVYGHKSGVALTMDVFAPKKGANGAAVVVVISGGWYSDQATIDSPTIRSAAEELLRRGYTVFAVCHGSQPRFIIPEAIADLNRALRFIRYHARDYHLDPGRIGISGGSAGGHLSLMQGVAGDRGNAQVLDPIERTSSRVQAVACFFPPTDFLNYGSDGQFAFAEDGPLKDFRTALDVRELDVRTHRLEHVTDKDKVMALSRRVSPITHVSADDAPTLIIHGDADKLVPIQQAEVMVAKLKKAGVPAELVVKKGAGHGWGGMEKDMVTIVDWFDKYLSPKK